MNKRILLLCIASFLVIQISAQNRTIDGSSNNLQNTSWGAVGTPLKSISTPSFDDGFSSPGGINRPNPRIISNTLFAQDSLIMDALELSDFTWVFGQFLDHDIVSTSSDPSEDASIFVNFPDPHFNPGGAFPNIQIFMSRSLKMPGSGTDINNPRRYGNNITSWIDASNVYGSDITRANYLRTFTDGKLKTSAGNLLPFNTDTNEYGDNIDIAAPHMENENPFNDQLFVAGDSRANENVSLASFHTLFVREHNRLCDELKATNPGWSDEQLYQHARKMIGGYIQSIVYDEWLPAMGVHMSPYSGYHPNVNGTITNVFSAAAFRLGHTLLSGTVPRMDNDGNTIPEGDLTLLEAFFAPYELVDAGGVDPVFKGMATQIEQELDCKMVDDVRNFLFGPPQAGLGGLDLASININRGRERGLPDFNTLRQDIGLSMYGTFNDINSDPAVAQALEDLYGTVFDIDPWVGMLAEDHMNDALFGSTIMKIMEDQFYDLREGDRFYYEIDPVLTQAEIDDIRNTTFRDIIMRNTGITVMQDNVFEAMPHDSICPASGPVAGILGTISTIDGDLVEGVDVEIMYHTGGTQAGNMTTDQDGSYQVDDLETCDEYDLVAEKNINHINGVSTLDIVFIKRHILELQLLNNPYKVLSADVNDDGNVSVLDIVDMRKLILNFQDTFTNNKSWRFIDEDITFADPNDPVEAVLDEASVDYLTDNTEVNFIGLKIGDVNGNANPNGFVGDGDTRNFPNYFTLETQDIEVKPGNDYSFIITAEELNQLIGMQFALEYNTEMISINEVIPGSISNLSASNFAIDKKAGRLSVSWDTENTLEEEVFFTVNFSASREGYLSDFIQLSTSYTKAEAYTADLITHGLELAFKDQSTTVYNTTFEVYQNAPNPFKDQTTIGFNLPEDDEVAISVYDLSGKIIYTNQKSFGAGVHAVSIDKELLKGTGVFYYQISSSFGSQTKKMILLNQFN